jgi:cytidylate kinase
MGNPARSTKGSANGAVELGGRIGPMFNVLTVAREFGSGGGAIAQRVAENLGWKLLDRDLIDTIARAAQVNPDTARRYDEDVDSWVHRIIRKGLWLGAFEGVATANDAEFFDAETMAALTKKVITEAAAAGNYVMVGRGAQCTLQCRPEVLHVFISAPWSERLARVRRRLGTGRDLEELIHWTDQKRANYIRTYFGQDWKDPHLYQLMINSQLGTDNVIRMITGAVGCGG